MARRAPGGASETNKAGMSFKLFTIYHHTHIENLHSTRVRENF